MYTVCLFGSGKIGEAICALLSVSKDYKIRICDIDLSRAEELSSRWKHTEPHLLDLDDKNGTKKLLKGADAVLSALPYYCNAQVAKLAHECKVHYLDLTEDVKTTDAVCKIGKSARTVFIPQSGLAPGFISVAASYLLKTFHKIDTVKLRVGALPIYPSNQLKYNLTWSTEGLINEYGNMCEVVDDGKKKLAFPLEGHESFYLKGELYEAFNTSGGLGSLCDTYLGKVRKLDYKSVRHVGHREYIAFLMNELRFNEDRGTLKNVLERSIPTTHQDKCLIFVEVTGYAKNQFIQKTYASIIYNQRVNGQHLSAIQLTTAAGICAPLDLVLTGKLGKKKGVVRCEDLPLLDFLDNRFGKYYKDDVALEGIR